MKPTLLDAINALIENAEVSVFGDENEDFKVLWLNGTKPVSNDKILEKLKELNTDYDNKKYQRDRLQKYPNTNDLIVALWEKIVEGRSESADALEVKRQEVKTAHPNPE